jgi:LacI family transcriptional regulator
MAERRGARRSSRGGGDSVTVQDLADAAGVSVASVSRALNNTGNVSEDVLRRVRDVADKMGYVPHAAARALASQKTHTIGAVVPTLENPNFAIGVEALQKRLTQAGYTLFVASCGYDMDQERQQVETLVTRGVDGIMLVGALHSAGLHDFLRSRNIPFVDTWVMSGDPRVPSVGFDNMAAAVQMTDFLLDLGHKNFGVIAGVTKSNDRAIARVKGIRKALKARGLPLKQERMIERPYRIVDGQLAMRALMSEKNRPTAVICGNDVLAFGAMLECQRLGIKIPGEVSIVGFDDLDFASQLVPPLTTINVPADKIGESAAEYLLAAVENRPNLLAPRISVNLIVRGSTAPPPARRT